MDNRQAKVEEFIERVKLTDDDINKALGINPPLVIKTSVLKDNYYAIAKAQLKKALADPSLCLIDEKELPSLIDRFRG